MNTNKFIQIIEDQIKSLERQYADAKKEQERLMTEITSLRNVMVDIRKGKQS